MSICRYTCVLLIILVMTIFTMSESSRTIKVGYDIAKMEQELKKLSEENQKLVYKSDRLRTFNQISLKVKNMKLGLVLPDDNEKIKVVKILHKRLYKSG